MAGAQAAADSPGLTVDVASLVAGEEEGDPGNLVGDGAAAQRVELADLALGAAGAGGVVHGLGHARLDDTGADGVAADAGARQLVGGRLHDGHDGGLARAVVGPAGVGAQAGDGGGADDGASRVGLCGRGDEHGFGGVLGGEEDAGAQVRRSETERVALAYPRALVRITFMKSSPVQS